MTEEQKPLLSDCGGCNMDDVPVAIEQSLGFPPLFARCNMKNPEGRQHELWVLEPEQGKQYYCHGVYKDKATLMKIAQILNHSRMFAESAVASFE